MLLVIISVPNRENNPAGCLKGMLGLGARALLRLALWYKVFDPFTCSFTKSQKLDLTASNSLRFAH